MISFDLKDRLLRDLSLGVIALAAAGLIAIGLSGVLSFALGQAFGKDFVAGDPPGVTYTPERCAEFLEYYHGSGGCAAAALSDHYDEVVFYRIAAGLLGLAALGAYVFMWHVWSPGGRAALPAVVLPTAGAVAFAIAALALLGWAASQLVVGVTSGQGGNVAGGLVAAVAFLIYAARFLRSLDPPRRVAP